MNFDFQAILFFIVLSLGLIWLIGYFYNKKSHSIVELSGALFPILLIVFKLSSFIFEPFRIPSGSMMPTVVKGDFILFQKYAFDLRMPVTNRSFWSTNELK